MSKFLLFAKLNRHCPRQSKRQWLMILAVLIFGFGPASLWAAKFTVTLDRDTTRVGESVTLSLNFQDASPAGAPSLPPLSGLDVTSIAQSSQYSFVNGQTSATQSFNYTLVPIQPGNITIPALQIEVDGKVLTS